MMKKISFITMLLFLLMVNGCSISKFTMSKITSTLISNDNVFTSDDDPELIRDALPFTIKFHESLVKKDSLNPNLFLSTGKLFCLYAQAFVQFSADTLPDSLKKQKRAMGKRAKKLFLRGRDYVLKGLDLKYPGMSNSIKKGSIDSVLELTNNSDTSFLYWSAISWMGAIKSDRSDLALAMSTKKALALMSRLLELNHSFDNGAVHEFFCAYYATAPKALGGSEKKSRDHFKKALDLSAKSKVSPYVTFASSLCIKYGYKNEFNEVLGKAVKINTRAFKNLQLQNTIYQQHAKWLLENQSRFFKIKTTQ